MAASMRTMKLFTNVFILRLSHLFLRRQSRKYSTLRRHNTPHKAFLLSIFPVSTVLAETTGKPFEPNDARLRSSECLKNAAGLSVDSTSAVLSQTVYAIIKVEKEYVELLDVLVQLLEYQMQVLGQKEEVDRIGDIVLETRYEINKVKQRKQDLSLLFASVEKLADATAEVAFATGSSYASTSAGERLYSAQQEVRRVLTESEKAEREVAYMEAQMVEQLTRHEDRMKLKQRIEEEFINIDNDDNNNESNNSGDVRDDGVDEERLNYDSGTRKNDMQYENDEGS